MLGLTSQQLDFKVTPSADNTIQILGTSNLHDWETNAGKFTVAGTVNNGEINNLAVTVETKSIDSGKSIMNDKTYEALKGDEFATITFKAASLKIVNGKIEGQGNLTLAGVTKPIKLTATSVAQAKGYKISGTAAVDMTQFGIEPPTAMFGSLTTGNQVTIKYDLILK